ncbi:MAG: MFS transporter [Planctomycetota bacterium]|nr:MAG: MFS transporter [Planctomycetota bacterium]
MPPPSDQSVTHATEVIDENRMRPLDWANALGFCVYASSAAITPITLLVLAQELQFSLAFAGTLEVARSLLIVVSLLASGFLAGRLGKARSLGFASLVLALGLFAYAVAPSVGLVLLALAVAGAGGGVIEGLINPLVQDQHPLRSGRYLNIVNGFWSVGVVLTMIGGGELLTREVPWRLLMAGLALVTLAAAAAYLRYADQERGRERIHAGLVWGQSLTILRAPAFWWFWLMMVIAGGVEGALTFWGAAYLQLDFGLSVRAGGIGVAIFGSGMIAGRFLVGLLTPQEGLHRMMLWSTILAALATFALPLLPHWLWVYPVLGLAGLGLACLWPSLQSYAAGRLPLDTTMLFILLSCGGIPGYALAAWAMGQVIDGWGFTPGFLMLGGVLVLLALMLLTVAPRRVS